jgi:hypothetical protein
MRILQLIEDGQTRSKVHALAETQCSATMECPHYNTSAEDGTPSPRLVCDDCGAAIVEPPGWWPAEPPRVEWVKRVLGGDESRLTE